MIVSDYTSLISGYSWAEDATYQKTVVTYSMPSALPDYIAQAGGDTAAFYNSFQAVTGTAADKAREALSIWESVANIQLVEVDSADADIVLGIYDFSFSDETNVIGYAYYPGFAPFGNDIAGDVFIDVNYASSLDLWLHEVGHALGLKHPHDGDPTLTPSLDNTVATIMSYNGANTGGLGYLDDDAISSIYTGDVQTNLIVSALEARTLSSSELMTQLRDYDGNALGETGSWKLIGEVDVQLDGDVELIYINTELGRWATLGPDSSDLINFENHGAGGDTRVVGIYIDPLVEAGTVVAGSDVDSQQRFANDLLIGNFDQVLGAGDYDGDGLQEIYLKTTDDSAYLHAYMHADGNIRYANYQSEAQMIAYLDQSQSSVDYSSWLLA